MALNIKENLRAFIANSRRVLVIAKKPDRKEFETMAKVTGIGIIIIAAIGYAIYLIFAFIPI
ncbi:MAG: protein translocase SEC61 complex subunit gamma [archaeon]